MFEVDPIHFPLIHSTNTWAKENVHAWEGDKLTLITASEQTGGRGRFKRLWVSPPDVNIYATFCFSLDPLREDLGHIPQLLALSTVQVLEELFIHPKIKWPNDLMLNGKKLAGILSESVGLDSGKRGMIIGIGLNVNMAQEDLNKIDRPATSLFVEKGEPYPLLKLLEALKNQFNQNLSVFIEQGFAPFWLEFQSLSYYKKGESISFHDNQKIVQGTFESLESDGTVTIRKEEKVIKLHAGEFIPKHFQKLDFWL